MNLKPLILLMMSLWTWVSFAQTQTKSFKISLPYNKTKNSLYSSIRLLDTRTDTTDFGIAQKGALNRRVKIVAERPLSVQLTDVVNALIDNTSKNGELLLVLRVCSFAEVSGAMSGKGYFHFRAVLFTQENGQYKKIVAIDTAAVVKAFDATQKMFMLGSETISYFLESNLTKVATDELTLSFGQLRSIDDIEKSNLPLYANSTYIDGIYYNFKSFVNQQPDETGVSASFDKKGRVLRISYTDRKGKPRDIENRFIYAFIYEGKPYISGDFTCYLMEKRNNDFYFTGKALDAKSGDVAMASAFFGVMGGLMASSATSVFEMKIDHLSGGFIRTKEVSK